MVLLTELIKESLEGKLSDQIRTSLASEDGEMNEMNSFSIKDMLFPQRSHIGYSIYSPTVFSTRPFDKTKGLSTIWKTKISRNNAPKYIVDDSSKSNMNVTDILRKGNVTWEKELPDIGTVQIANIRGIKYMKIISSVEGETLTTYVFY